MKKTVAWVLLIGMLSAAVGYAEQIDYKALYEENLSYLEDNIHRYFEGQGEGDMVAAYDEPVTVAMVNSYNSYLETSMSNFTDRYGETFNANRWTDAIERAFNVKIEYKWWANASDYTEKLRLDMAADDLADMFYVIEQSDLAQLAEAGAIWDLSGFFDEYATAGLRENWASDGGMSMNEVTFNGGIYGLPLLVSYTDEFSYLWLRRDWMEALNLENPKTIDDLVAIMDAFRAADFDGNGADDTLGMICDSGLWYATRGLFNAFAAYPKYWIEKDGALTWGGIEEECKSVLSLLTDMYANGYIDKEFATQSYADQEKAILNGKAGVAYAGHWLGHVLGDLHEMDPDSDWYCVPLPTGNGEAVRSPLVVTKRGYAVVNSKFEHPEIAFKILSLGSYIRYTGAAAWWQSEEGHTHFLAPLKGVGSAYSNLTSYLELAEYYKTGDESVLSYSSRPYLDRFAAETGWEWELMFGSDPDVPFVILNDAYENDLLFYNAFLGVPSDFMQDRWSTIQDEQLIAFTRIIIGETSVDEGWAAWLKTWESMGGPQIITEVNEWYAENQANDN